jgi:hypothetical protein
MRRPRVRLVDKGSYYATEPVCPRPTPFIDAVKQEFQQDDDFQLRAMLDNPPPLSIPFGMETLEYVSWSEEGLDSQ